MAMAEFTDRLKLGLDRGSTWLTVVTPAQAIVYTCFGLISVWLLRFLYQCVYNLYFHPLAGYPGPKLDACTRLPNSIGRVLGTRWLWLQQAHEKYGPVVRSAPNELSYIDERVWSDVYANKRGRPEMPKGGYQPAPGLESLFDHPSHEEHIRIRKAVRNGFTEKAVREQELPVRRYVDLLMDQLRKCAKSGQPTDIAMWVHLIAYDIVADLATGEDFKGVENGEPHRWIGIGANTAAAFTVFQESGRIWLLSKILPYIPSLQSAVALRMQHKQTLNNALEKRRLGEKAEPDFMTHAVHHLNQPGGITLGELQRSFEIITTAASDTAATCIIAAVYYLSQNPRVYEKLKAEIRGTFASEAAINIEAVRDLPYLLAVLKESLRIHPPVPGNHSRIVSGEGAEIVGKWVPPGTLVSFPHWAGYHSKLNWNRPDDFVPERWMGDPEFDSDNRACFHPFSHGPRECLGQNVANGETRIILSRFVYNFDMELESPDLPLTHGAGVRLVWTHTPLMVRVKSAVR
ncbi:unnamed protein product [Discula destructiva]